jgi:hypothetical protein
MHGCQTGTTCPILHAQYDRVYTIGFGDGAGAAPGRPDRRRGLRRRHPARCSCRCCALRQELPVDHVLDLGLLLQSLQQPPATHKPETNSAQSVPFRSDQIRSGKSNPIWHRGTGPHSNNGAGPSAAMVPSAWQHIRKARFRTMAMTRQ